MSICALTELKVARTDLPRDRVGLVDTDKPKRSVSDALAIVVAYVPTEIIAIYTLLIATLGDTGSVAAAPLPLWSFWAFVTATPLFVWLLYAVRCVEERKPIPWSWADLPRWEAISAAIAFTAWSATLPRSPFREFAWYDSGVAAIVLVVVSIVLPLIGTLVTRKP